MSRTTAALAVALITLMALIVAGCAREKSTTLSTAKGKYKVSLTVLKPPMKKGYNDLALRVRDSHGQPVTDADIRITPWMPEMDHGVMGIPKVSHAGRGVYKSKVFLGMPGHWEIRVSVKSGEVTDSAIFDFTGVKG